MGELAEATDRLTDLLLQAQEVFRRANELDGATASVELEPAGPEVRGDSRLHWKRYNTEWMLWVENAAGEMTSLFKASRHRRILAASKLEALFDALADAQAAMADDVVRAVQQVEVFVQEHAGEST